MLEIFICEDNEMQRQIVTDFIKNYIMIEDLDMKVTLSTDKPHDIIDYIEYHSVNGLYFLDVDLQTEMTGIDLATSIRKYDKRCALVFITTHPEFMSLTFDYGVEAMDYISKGNREIMKEKIKKCIHLANSRLLAVDTSKQMFQFKSEGKVISEEYDHIMFFEVSLKKNHKITMYAKNRQVEFYGTLNEIEKISNKFFRCHRSCLVNRDNIETIDIPNGEIHMKNGDVCYGSTRGIKKLMKIMAVV